ncbi:MAG: biotin--[acetyl-CoA-carboxylase] ligase [Chloroflexi bacterium]|nr:biotin--[acetyl-CoA-carboxylase] ligase [Chloroflexota bacterium]
MTAIRPAVLGRFERFESVGSTNDVVRDWLAAGEPEVCVAVADVQTAGRGRGGRSWTAPAGAALLVSLGFRPTWLDPDHVWRLAAVVSLAMAEASEAAVGLASGTIRLKWPNDLVAVADDGVRKLGGLLGETDGLGGPDPRAVVGIGVNVGWAPAAFSAELRGSMTSLHELAGRSVDREAVLEGFLQRLEPSVAALRSGHFAAEEWSGRQVTTGRRVTLSWPDGSTHTRQALGVDDASGALIVADDDRGRRLVVSGEIVHVRLGESGGGV